MVLNNLLFVLVGNSPALFFSQALNEIFPPSRVSLEVEEFGISVGFTDVIDSRALSFPGLLNYSPTKDAILEFAPQAMFRIRKVSRFLSNVQSQNHLLGH